MRIRDLIEARSPKSESDAERYFDRLGFWFRDKTETIRGLAYDAQRESEDLLAQHEDLMKIWDKEPSQWSGDDRDMLRQMMTKRQFDEMMRHWDTLFG